MEQVQKTNSDDIQNKTAYLENTAQSETEKIIELRKSPLVAPHPCKRSASPAQNNNNNGPAKKVPRRVFIYGNYDRYYGYRNKNVTPEEDVRLRAFVDHRDWFEGKRILDIGCNNGSLTLQVAKHCQPAGTVGIDIDGDLIGSARKHQKIMLKAASSHEANALKQVNFRQANYVYRDESLLDSEKPQFDVILCLSVTKWIQLNFGDAAMKLVFRRVFRQLNRGGRFILEAQPWSSYRNRRKLTKEIAENYKNIRFRPEAFNEYLLGDEIGFREVSTLTLTGTATQGFRRPIYVFKK